MHANELTVAGANAKALRESQKIFDRFGAQSNPVAYAYNRVGNIKTYPQDFWKYGNDMPSLEGLGEGEDLVKTFLDFLNPVATGLGGKIAGVNPWEKPATTNVVQQAPTPKWVLPTIIGGVVVVSLVMYLSLRK